MVTFRTQSNLNEKVERSSERSYLYNCFKMKIVDDKLTYLDEDNKSLGYEVTSGKQRMKSSVVDFMTGRGKNKKKGKV